LKSNSRIEVLLAAVRHHALYIAGEKLEKLFLVFRGYRRVGMSLGTRCAWGLPWIGSLANLLQHACKIRLMLLP
jgi:hypothetical protein